MITTVGVVISNLMAIIALDVGKSTLMRNLCMFRRRCITDLCKRPALICFFRLIFVSGEHRKRTYGRMPRSSVV